MEQIVQMLAVIGGGLIVALLTWIGINTHRTAVAVAVLMTHRTMHEKEIDSLKTQVCALYLVKDCPMRLAA